MRRLPNDTADATSPGHGSKPLVDGCGRRMDHLRLSLTGACDLRCVYCQPVADKNAAASDITDAQRVDFVRMMHRCYRISQVRLSGGEPLMYRDVVPFVRMLREAVPGVSLVMTTNGVRLDRFAAALRSAGLERINISIDSIDAHAYRRITGGDLQRAMGGLAAARQAGFPPPKINTVVIRGRNDGELSQMVAWAAAEGLEIRFLEVMPIGPAVRHNRENFVSAAEILARLRESFAVEPVTEAGVATARRYRVTRGSVRTVVGIIAPMTGPFCGACRRVRLSAEGWFYPCLLDERHVDVTEAWADGSFAADKAAALVARAVAGKEREGPRRQTAAMVKIGG